MTVPDESAPDAARKRIRRWLDTQTTAVLKIRRDILADEPALMPAKWFDYRFITPYGATIRFLRDYKHAARAIYRANFDAATVDQLGLISRQALEGGREFTSLWLARQCADHLGVPYPHYIRGIMEGMMRNGWKRVPRPNQLYAKKGNTKFQRHLDEVMRAWAEWTSARLIFSEDPRYLNENDCGHQTQIAHHEWIIEQVRKRANPHLGLGTLCFSRRFLPESKALAAFGATVLDRAREEAEPPVDRNEMGISRATDSRLAPSCFGLPGAHAETGVCRACPFESACAKLISRVERDMVVAGLAFATPDARHRAGAAERKRKSRAKETEAEAIVSI